MSNPHGTPSAKRRGELASLMRELEAVSPERYADVRESARSDPPRTSAQYGGLILFVRDQIRRAAVEK